jgi:hypothetical protein
MGSKEVFKIKVGLFTLLYLAVLLKVFYAQEPDVAKEPKETVVVVEQALRNFEIQKQSQLDEFKAQLNARLQQATKNWLASTEEKRMNQLDNVVEQEWDKQARIAMILPVNYVYYLRGYKYNVVDSDIIRAESLTPTYKAVVNIREELYAEKSHHGSAGDIKPYLYTVTNICTLNFIFKDNEFILVKCDTKMEKMVNEMSSEARREWLWKWL